MSAPPPSEPQFSPNSEPPTNNPLRLLIWGINFEPELTGIAPFNTGLCEHLREQGHQVEMVTAFPYYPFWKKIPGDAHRIFRTDDFDGINVHRCWHYVPQRVTTLKRIWHELSFALTSFYRVLRLPRADVYVIVSPPLILGPLAMITGFLKRRPYVFHVQDLQPDAALGLGMVRAGRFTRMLYRIEAFAYRHAAAVSGISQGMLRAFTRKGVPATQQVFFPNWIRWYGHNLGLKLTAAEREQRAALFRKKYDLPAGTFVATYSGNLGRKQSLETLLDAAALLPENAPILILIGGDGVMREQIAERLRVSPARNIRLMPLLRETDYHGMLLASNVCVILQAPGTGQYFFPSKLLSVLSAGVPVLSTADDDSELALAVRTGGFGRNVPAANPSALAAALVELARDPVELGRLRERTTWVEQFTGERVLGDFERKLLELGSKNRRA